MLTMTFENLTPRQAALLEALQGGEWMTRQQLADATGKRMLSPNDRNHLDELERRGLIEIDKQPINAPQRFEYIYRLREATP